MGHARTLIPIVLFLLSTSGIAQEKKPQAPPAKGDPRWVRIDSLAKVRQPASALKLTEELLAKAQREGDWRTEFRAWMYRGRFRLETGVDRKSILGDLEARVRELTDTTIAPRHGGQALTQEEIEMGMPPREDKGNIPLRQLLHSVLGQAYWDHYKGERWRILQRTVSDEEGADMDTWDQRAYMRRIVHHFSASLEPFDTLARIPAAELRELFSGPKVTDPRERHGPWFQPSGALEEPMLYSLLARRALAVFTNPETRLTEPAWRFRLDEPAHFEVYGMFPHRPITHRDSTAWEFLALRVFQRLERSHLADDEPISLTDATLARLAFVRRHSILPQKDSLYHAALSLLRSRIERLPAWSEVTLAMARFHAEQAEQYQRLAGDEWKWERKTARDLCDVAIARHPGSFGARNAMALKARLEEPSISSQVEQAVPPDTAFAIALTYRNTKQVWLRVVKDPVSVNEGYVSKEQREKNLLAKTPVAAWNVELPDDGDLNTHLIELPVQGLPFGHYAIIVSDGSGFRRGTDRMAYTAFWVTRLAMADRSQGRDLDLLVVDRVSGAPKEGVRVVACVREHLNKPHVCSKDMLTKENGMVRTDFQNDRGNLTWSLSDGNDTYISGSRWIHTITGSSTPDSLRTFLFTDRAIYRPGQEVHFKGIVTVKRGGGTEVKAGHATVVKVYDVNHQVVDSIPVTTDEFGAFHGSTKAPGGLTGLMNLYERHGNRNFRVEEYKRPTFELLFDPIADTPKLEGTATLTGQAKSYAGVPLDGARVRWTVKRSARMPWWCGVHWRGLPGWGRETEVASGEAECDAQGRFSISFTAQADKALPRRADPVFIFSVEANITDISGETQRGSTSLSVGHRSVDIAIDGGDAIDRKRVDSLGVRVRNLNGQDVDLPMDVRVSEVRVPAYAPLRERYWERPDRFLAGQEPLAEDPLDWPLTAAWLERKDWKAGGRALKLEGIAAWPVGLYRIDVAVRDPEGNAVEVSKVLTVYDSGGSGTGFVHKAFHAEPIKTTVEPGGEAEVLLSSGLSSQGAQVLVEVERDGAIAETMWITLHRGQQVLQWPVSEADRGGFAVHLLHVSRGRITRETQWIDVPWSNKDLQVEWTRFRDKLLPGAREEWRLRITGPKKEQVSAQLLAAMYDASLDRFTPHGWEMGVWKRRQAMRGWARTEPFRMNRADRMWRKGGLPGDSARTLAALRLFGGPVGYHWYDEDDRDEVVFYEVVEEAADLEVVPGRSKLRVLASPRFNGDGVYEASDEDPIALRGMLRAMPSKPEEDPSAPGHALGSEPPPLRTDFRETAFFFPDLLTDRDGAVVLRFTVPDALTRWKVLGLAHTTDLKLAHLTRETVTSKPLMAVPNLPRFLRQGDRITLTAKVNVLEGEAVQGTARLELFDPRTNEAVSKAFGLTKAERSFTAAPGQSAALSWSVDVPEGLDAVAVRITATAGSFTDGEERVLPILTDQVLVTESLPIAVSKAGTRTFELGNLVRSVAPVGRPGGSTLPGPRGSDGATMRHHNLTLEFTPNPAWYAVQALPYLMEFPHECAEQVFGRYYANRLAAHVVAERPAIREVFEQWRADEAGNEGAFLSALEKNPELKGIVLEETPWVMNLPVRQAGAKDEGERKRRIALLFDLKRMAAEEATALRKLREAQLGDGGWPWFKGMRASRHITQHIVAGLGHLERLGAADLRPDGETQRMLKRAVNWLDNDAARDHRERQRDLKKEELAKYRPGYSDIQYLYARSFFPRWPVTGGANTAAQFLRERLAATWTGLGLQEQALAAMALHRSGDKTTAALIVTSLRERATRDEELGMYWKGFARGMDWQSFPIETHALMVEAFDEVAMDADAVNALRQYLLSLKRTTDWGTTKATAEAVYALLLTGDAWLQEKEAPVIKVGGVAVEPGQQEAGTGTFTKQWSAADIKPAMGRVTVTTTSDGIAWGALHWQYFEAMDKVRSHGTPFSLRRQVMLREQTVDGTRLIALDKARVLRPGDRLTVRIELRTDRWIDFVHLKDLRAAGLEPVEALSGHRYQAGLGYYQSIRDAAMHFFFDRIAPGTYVFEYDLVAGHEGDFSHGITSAQCMYAPEFGSHSAGLRIVVGNP